MTGVECHQPDFPSLKPSTPPQLNVDTKSNLLEDVSPFKLVFFWYLLLKFQPHLNGKYLHVHHDFSRHFLACKILEQEFPYTSTRLHHHPFARPFSFFFAPKRDLQKPRCRHMEETTAFWNVTWDFFSTKKSGKTWEKHLKHSGSSWVFCGTNASMRTNHQVRGHIMFLRTTLLMTISNRRISAMQLKEGRVRLPPVEHRVRLMRRQSFNETIPQIHLSTFFWHLHTSFPKGK